MMRFNVCEPDGPLGGASPLRRLTAGGGQWRVRVQSWRSGEGYHGRLVFEPEGRFPRQDHRCGPPALRGGTREELVAAAYDLPEPRLRALLHSLG
jgi:hypothetical protein